MRRITFSIAVFVTVLSSACLAQPATTDDKATDDKIGHPPPLPSPPPIPDPSLKGQAAPTASTPAANEPPKGYTGAYAPAGTPPTPYSSGPLPTVDTGVGLNKVAPDGSTKSVKAVPCGLAARETDGSTTCVGISDEGPKKRPR
jgi:hypothetical protein